MWQRVMSWYERCDRGLLEAHVCGGVAAVYRGKVVAHVVWVGHVWSWNVEVGLFGAPAVMSMVGEVLR